MKKLRPYLFMLAAFFSTSVWAQWEKPVAPSAELQFSTLGSDTTMYYLYNEDVGAFYINGNLGKTQTSFTSNLLGIKVFFSKNLDSDGNWDDKTIQIHDLYPRTNGVWYNMYIYSENISFVDRTVSDDYYWEYDKNADGTYRFRGADINPTYSTTNYPSCYWGIDLTMGDTIIYPLLDISEDPTGNFYLVDWKLVPVSDDFVEKWDAYTTAQHLDALIKKTETGEYASELSEELTNAKSVYNNTNSTSEELTEVINELLKALRYASLKGASDDNPKDATFFIQNPNFDENMDGWGFTYEFGKTADILTRQARTDSSDGYTMTNFIEAASTSIYNPNLTYNALGDGSIYQIVKELPAGKYMFACDLHNTSQFGSNPCTGTYLFAENSDVSQEMEIHNELWIEHVTFTFVTTGGDVTLGMKTRNSTANWIAIDNITLTYYGEIEVDPEKANLDTYIATCEERYPSETFEDVIANQEVKESYQQALENAKNATENYQEARSSLEEAIAALDKSIEEYKKYKETIDNAYKKCAEFDGTKWVELQDQLYDYLMEWEDSYNHGTATSEDIAKAETAFNEHVFNGMTSMMEPGDDITSLLINPQFEEGTKGWTNIPEPTGEAYNKFCLKWNGTATSLNYYQTITGLPNGKYKLTCQGCYRYGWTQDAANNVNNKDAECAFIYANDSSAPLMPVFKGAKSEKDAAWTTDGIVDGVTYYIPYWDAEWSAAFSEGGFAPTDEYNTVIGTVVDGTLIFGVRQANGLNGECTQFDNFHLIFMEAQGNDEARNTLGEAIAEADSIAQLRQNSSIQSELASELSNAKAIYEQTTLVANAYTNAYVALQEKLNKSKESVDMYENIASLNAKAEGFDQSGKTAYEPTLTAYEEGSIEEYETAYNQYLDAMKSQTTPGSDMTDLIINFDFEHGTKGWEGGLPNPTGNDLNKMALKWNASAAPYNFYQTITGLPNGKYKITCQGCYRYGEVGTAANNVGNKGAELAVIYGNAATAPIMPAFKGAHTVQDGAYTAGANINGENYYIPYWDGEWADAFRTGGFAPTSEYNTVTAEVTDGVLTLGIKKDLGIDLECIQFDNFTLTYLADGFKKGDVNLDGKVDISDIVAIINTIAGDTTYVNTADVNEDTNKDISDIVAVINIIAGNE